MKPTNILLGIAALVGIGVAASKATKENTSAQDDPTPTPTNTDSKAPKDLNAFPLTNGSYGSNVRELQTLLNSYFEYNGIKTKIGVDGQYGGQTELAVKSLFNISRVTQNQVTWLKTTIAAYKLAKTINDLKVYIGRTVKLITPKTLIMFPASAKAPITGQSIKLSNGYYIQNSGLSKSFLLNTPFKVAYESDLTVILDYGSIIKPDLNSGKIGSDNSLITSSRYFLAYKKDIKIIA
ncbi:MAG: peptidoglycan-binding domain-containing protein [bacterium]|nr:peptidoglycan-binding domain-containing protein [bacterium]